MLMRTTLLLLTALSCFTGCSSMPDQHPPQTGILFESIETEERTYDYAVYVPRGYDGTTPMPAIVFLHGYGESGFDGQHQVAVGIGPRLVWDVETWPFIVLMPQKPAADQWGDHAPAVARMLGRMTDEYQIDRDRVYLTGLSQGGNGTWTLNALIPETFAAIAPVCGYGVWTPPGASGGREWSNDMSVPELRPVIEAAARVPVWAFHGDADDVVPADQTRRLVEAIRAAGGDPKMTVYEGVNHNAWDRAYSREQGLATWLLANRRDGNSAGAHP